VSSTSGGEFAGIPVDVLAPDARTREIVTPRLNAATPRRRGWLLHRALAAADVVGLLGAFLFAVMVFPEKGQGRIDLASEITLFALLLPLWILLAKLHGLYDRDEDQMDHSTVDDITGVFNVVTIGTWLFFLITTATSVLSPSLERVTTFWLLAIAILPLARAVARSLCRRTVMYVQNTVVVGAGPVGRQVAQKILAHPEYGLNLVGFVDPAPSSTNGAVGSVPILGTPQELRKLVQALDVQRVIVSFTDDSHQRTLALVRGLRDLEVQIDIVPRLFEALGTNASLHMIEGMPFVGLPPLRLSPSARFLKRSLDVIGATVGLLLLSPLFVATAISIKIDSRGPILFRQIRSGEHGRAFRIFKFRTMTVDAEARKIDIAHLNMHKNEDSRMFKIPNDPRVTGVGRILRRWSIDELPQLINVLRGEMSLVGPRPLILAEDIYVEAWAKKRLQLRPGMTGLWQVLGGSDIPFAEMTKLDYIYVTSWSLKEDIRLIILTFPALIRSRKAF
jgi:exopolysaccharide biosynthesis polyprenyl glycosylphosphotransferase